MAVCPGVGMSGLTLSPFLFLEKKSLFWDVEEILSPPRGHFLPQRDGS